ncbi:hypothetical protein [Leyella stercorea]|uniref:hypothetical protein n=1 Tax=Leyella stercorea TaxID=363265 RepID=UPI00266C1B7F|nr:hypothetical protein [Leyella stercorea]
MKKILSLLSMLMITVMAFATDYKDALHFEVNLMGAKTVDLPSGTLSIDKRVDGTYTVTAQGCDFSAYEMGNWYEIICDEVAGTTDANGVTTINVDSPYAFRSSDNATFSSTKLVVKFNDTKAYASFEGKIYIYANRDFKYTFGTDEGFEGGGSTGGGETGGEDKPAIVDVVEADYAPNGAAFGFPFTINWQTQKLVAKLDLSTCSRYTHNEGIITVGTNNGSGDISLWNPNAGEANCHLYYTHYNYGTDEKQLNLHYLEKPSDKVVRVDNSLQNLEPGLVVFTFDKNGLHVGDNLIATPDQMSTLYNSTSLVFGSKEGSTRSNATYKYVKVVPADWTETTEPTEPEVTVVATKKFDAIDYSNTWSQAGTANVTFEEMSDETVKMKFATDGINISANALTKGTDAKNRTTYTGEAVNDAMSTLTYTIKAVVYTEGTEEKLYMTMEANSGVTFTVGTDPDYVAPEPPAGESTIVENWKSTEGTSWSHDVTIDWNTQKLVVSVNLADTGSDKGFLGVTKKGNTPGWNNDGIIFYNVDGTTVQGYAPGQPNNANTNYVTKGEDPVRFEISKDGGVVCQGNTVISASNIAHLTAESEIVVGAADKVAGALYNYIKVVSLDWKETTEPEVTVVSNKTYTSNLRILDGETTVVEEAEADVNIIKYSDESYKVTLKNVNMLNKTQDLVFVGKALIEEAPTEATEPLTIIAKSDEATTAFFGEEMSATFEITEVSAEEIKMGFVLNNTSLEYQGEFNYTEEETPEVYTSNLHIYDAAAPETDLFQADQAKVEFLATATGGFKLTLKDVTLNEKTQDLVFTGTLPTPEAGGQEPLAEEGEVTPAEPAMVLNAIADEATTDFFGVSATYATAAVFNVSYDKNDNFMMTFTITAGAKNYGGEFNYEKKDPETPDVTVKDEKTFTDAFSLNNVSLGNAKVTIKEMSDKTINMVFTFGTNDFTSTDLVKGTDDKNRTTYTGTISIGGVECVVNGVVYTKDNAEKLYMTLVSTTSGTYVFGTEPTDTPEPPVVEEYPINFDKDANSTHSSRVLNSFSLQQTGKDKQTKSVKTSKAAYEDHTADEPFTVEAGSELTASFDYTGEWMHSFVYIDFDNDGDFSYKEGQWDQTGTDLVAFSFYSLDSNPKNDASGYNSVGDELTGDARNTYAAPSFKAPAKAGEYRIRFKIDWNCILPGGSSTILEDGGGVWDATLKVVEPVVDGISTINVEAANGEAQLFTIDGVKLNKLQKGLNIVRTADGKVKKVLVK